MWGMASSGKDVRSCPPAPIRGFGSARPRTNARRHPSPVPANHDSSQWRNALRRKLPQGSKNDAHVKIFCGYISGRPIVRSPTCTFKTRNAGALSDSNSAGHSKRRALVQAVVGVINGPYYQVDEHVPTLTDWHPGSSGLYRAIFRCCIYGAMIQDRSSFSETWTTGSTFR